MRVFYQWLTEKLNIVYHSHIFLDDPSQKVCNRTGKLPFLSLQELNEVEIILFCFYKRGCVVCVCWKLIWPSLRRKTVWHWLNPGMTQRGYLQNSLYSSPGTAEAQQRITPVVLTLAFLWDGAVNCAELQGGFVMPVNIHWGRSHCFHFNPLSRLPWWGISCNVPWI